MIDRKVVYTVRPEAIFDEPYWFPKLTIEVNGDFERAIVFELPCESYGIAAGWAERLAHDQAAMMQQGMEATLEHIRQKLGVLGE